MYVKLGKRPPREDRRTLRMAKFVPIFPAPPVAADWTAAVEVDWQDFLNTFIGLCTIAAAFHADMTWTANASSIYVPTDAQAVSDYSALTGYKANDPSSDVGAVELDVLNRWRTVGLAGRKILAFMAVDPKNREQVKAAIHLFGGVYVGVAMPDSWQGQIDNKEPWTWGKGDRPNQNNGHALWVPKYDENFIYPVTWGQLQPAAWDWSENCCDECWVILSLDWINGPNSPSALDRQALEARLSAL